MAAITITPSTTTANSNISENQGAENLNEIQREEKENLSNIEKKEQHYKLIKGVLLALGAILATASAILTFTAIVISPIGIALGILAASIFLTAGIIHNLITTSSLEVPLTDEQLDDLMGADGGLTPAKINLLKEYGPRFTVLDLSALKNRAEKIDNTMPTNEFKQQMFNFGTRLENFLNDYMQKVFSKCTSNAALDLEQCNIILKFWEVQYKKKKEILDFGNISTEENLKKDFYSKRLSTLQRHLKDLPRLFSKIGTDAKVLAESLKHCSNLKSLSISPCLLTTDVLKSVNDKIKSINLSFTFNKFNYSQTISGIKNLSLIPSLQNVTIENNVHNEPYKDIIQGIFEEMGFKGSYEEGFQKLSKDDSFLNQSLS